MEQREEKKQVCERIIKRREVEEIIGEIQRTYKLKKYSEKMIEKHDLAIKELENELKETLNK